MGASTRHGMTLNEVGSVKSEVESEVGSDEFLRVLRALCARQIDITTSIATHGDSTGTSRHGMTLNEVGSVKSEVESEVGSDEFLRVLCALCARQTDITTSIAPLPGEIARAGNLTIDGRNLAQMILRMPIIKLHHIGRFAHRYGIIDR